MLFGAKCPQGPFGVRCRIVFWLHWDSLGAQLGSRTALLGALWIPFWSPCGVIGGPGLTFCPFCVPLNFETPIEVWGRCPPLGGSL